MTLGIVVPCSGEQAAQLVVDGLSQRGFHVVRSFDLNVATNGLCDCPHHGTEKCTCQYVVLLVYGATGAPAVVTPNSRDEQSHLEIVSDANAPSDPSLVDHVLTALVEAGGTYAGAPCHPSSPGGGS